MIFDVARHKLIEAIITLSIIALATVICNIAIPSAEVVDTTTAPLGMLIAEFQQSHNIISTILGFVLIFRLSMMVTRTTVRTRIYDANSFGAMSVVPLAIMMLATPYTMLTTIVVAMLVAEAMRRIFFAFSSEQRINAIFTAMLALGTLPLIDSPLFVVVCALPLIVIALRCSLRDFIIAVVGMILPIFTYAYIVWCLGGDFGATIEMFYHSMLTPSLVDVEALFTLPRIGAIVILLLVGLCSVVFYAMNSRSMKPATRHTWDFMISSVLLLCGAFVLLPSITATSLVVITMLVSTMTPMLFLRLGTLLSMLIYVVILGLSVATMV